MSERVQVVDAETPERSSSATPRSGWVLFALGFAVGIGAAVVFITPTGSSPTDTTIPGAVAPPDTPESPETVELGVADMVEGFPDALVAVSRTSGSSFNHVLWPHGGGVNIKPMSGGDNAVFDSSGRFIALTAEVPGGTGVVLSSGRHNQIRNVGTGVTAHAWHDSESGVLAFTTMTGGTWRLSTIKANFQPMVVLESDTALGHIAAWGHWGWALQSGTEVILLTPEGELKDTEPGMALASHRSGWVFVHDGTAKLVSAGGGVIRLEGDLEVGVPSTAVFSPDAEKLAVAGERGVAIMYLKTGAVETVSEFSTPVMTWSSDSRFLLTVSGPGVIIIDDEQDDFHRVLREHSVLAVSVVPLSGS